MALDSDLLERLADEAGGLSWYELNGDIVSSGGAIQPDFVARPSEAYKEYLLAVSPAKIKALVAEIHEARRQFLKSREDFRRYRKRKDNEE